MRFKNIIKQHQQALAEAQGKREEAGFTVGIHIEVKPVITWQQLARMTDGSARRVATDAPPNTPEFKPVAVKTSGCCRVM